MRRRILAAFLVFTVAIQIGCASRDAGAATNLELTIDKAFVTKRASYRWWPAGGDSLFNGDSGGGSGGCGGSFDCSGGSGEGALLVLAVVVAVVVVAVTTDVTVHNIDGVDLSLVVSGDGGVSRHPIHWGLNRLALPPSSIGAIEAGRGTIAVEAEGTRHLRAELPLTVGIKPATLHRVIIAPDAVTIDGSRIEPRLNH